MLLAQTANHFLWKYKLRCLYMTFYIFLLPLFRLLVTQSLLRYSRSAISIYLRSISAMASEWNSMRFFLR